MRLQRNSWLRYATGTLITAGLVASCGILKKEEENVEPSDNNVTIIGQLSLTGGDAGAALNLTAAVDVTTLTMYCVSFEIPPKAGTGTFDAEGKFSVTIDTKDVSVGCFILDAEESILGTMVFEDPSQTDISGSKKNADRHAFGAGTSDLGAIVLDLDTGKAVVDITKIKVKTAAAVKDSVAKHDFTGSYKATIAGIELPTGYGQLCTEEQVAASKNGGEECRGPEEGMNLFFKQINGSKVAGGDAHAMMIWQSEELFTLCGEKLGISYEKAKEHGYDFSASGVGEGEFDWSAGYVDGWKKADATARWNMSKMDSVDDFKGYSGTRQFFTRYVQQTCNENGCQEGSVINAPGFQFNANTKESGCRDSSGKPYQMNDWSNMECTGQQLEGTSAGLHKSTCSKTIQGEKITCVHISGAFLDNGTAINGRARYPEDFVTFAQQGDLCSSINTNTDEGKLAQLRCYAEANHGGGGGGGSDDECVREVRGNWSAKTPEEFFTNSDGPVRARGEFVMEIFEFDSATSGRLRGEERSSNGVRVGDNWTDCEVNEVFSMALRKADDAGNLMAEMIMEERNISPKPVCIAEYGAGKVRKYLFKLEKQ